MVQFRPQAKEIIAKVVYYGPPLGGKTTNLRTLYRGYPANTRGELVVVPTGTDRTIFFDFLPVSVGTLRGMNLRVQLYTVPGQVHFNTTRQVVLRGVDGVVFVADSQKEMLAANRTSFANLKENLLLQGLALADTPHVVQFNKRDLKDILSVEELNEAINETNAPFFEAVATVGIGVEETLQGVVRLVARSLRERFKLPLEAGAAHDGLFTHVPSQSVGVDRPFDTAKIDAPSVYVAGTQPSLTEDTRPLKVAAVPPGAGEAERVISFSQGGAPTDDAGRSAPFEVATGPTREDAFAATLPEAGEAFPPQGPGDDGDEPVFATVDQPLDPFTAGPLSAEISAAVPPRQEEPGEVEVFASGTEDSVPAPLLVPEEKPAPLLAAGEPGEPPGSADSLADAMAPAALWLQAPAAAQQPDVFAVSEMPVEHSTPLPPPLLVDPYADPFADEVAAPPPCMADVFSIPGEETARTTEAPLDEAELPAAAAEEDLVFESLAPMAVQVEVEEGAAAGERLAPLPDAVVQRVVPRALAQFGEVRELELEVPVPAAWVGGRRMTLQLRLTLVPEEDVHVG